VGVGGVPSTLAARARFSARDEEITPSFILSWITVCTVAELAGSSRLRPFCSRRCKQCKMMAPPTLCRR
jgi:hypothetical protein